MNIPPFCRETGFIIPYLWSQLIYMFYTVNLALNIRFYRR